MMYDTIATVKTAKTPIMTNIMQTFARRSLFVPMLSSITSVFNLVNAAEDIDDELVCGRFLLGPQMI